MKVDDAARLVANAVAPRGGTWADLGAGTGTFTRALAQLLGPQGRVFAVERDAASVATLERLASKKREADAPITVMRGDFTEPLSLPPLDGALLANALHFVSGTQQATTLGRLLALLQPGGRLVVVEYEDRPASRWVPHPVSLARLGELSATLGLAPPMRVGERPSAFGGTMYAAFVTTPARER